MEEDILEYAKKVHVGLKHNQQQEQTFRIILNRLLKSNPKLLIAYENEEKDSDSIIIRRLITLLKILERNDVDTFETSDRAFAIEESFLDASDIPLYNRYFFELIDKIYREYGSLLSLIVGYDCFTINDEELNELQKMLDEIHFGQEPNKVMERIDILRLSQPKEISDIIKEMLDKTNDRILKEISDYYHYKSISECPYKLGNDFSDALIRKLKLNDNDVQN